MAASPAVVERQPALTALALIGNICLFNRRRGPVLLPLLHENSRFSFMPSLTPWASGLARLTSRTCSRLVMAFALLVSLAPNVIAAEDPFESVNRAVFSFNDAADRWVVRPVAKGYDSITPTPVRLGVNNFFNNVLDANAGLNALLQGRVEFGVDNLSRFAVNTTLGLLGLFDVASGMGIPRYQTDFGHTLAIWGTPQGPYLVLPLLGPRTARSGVGTVVDGYATPLTGIDSSNAEWGLRTLQIVDLRAGLLGADRLLSGDRYIFFRDAYLQQRAVLTQDGQAVDDFSEFDDDWEADDL